MADAQRPTARLIGKKTDEEAPRPGQPQPSYPRSEWCQACARTTTHVRQGCTRCMGKEDNRKQGTLFLAIGVALLAIGLGLGWVGLGTRHDPGASRRRLGSVPYLAIMALAGGLSLAAKGGHAMVTGSDPEAEQ
jgi:hypothetical protein